MPEVQIDQPVGEIMVSRTQGVEAQCYRLHAAPPLGTLLRIGTPPVYAVVREIRHEPIDPTRPLAPRGGGMESEDQVYAAHPQLTAMLTTRFAATVVGYHDGSGIRQGLPAQPPNLHAFVFVCDGADLSAFASDLRWLRLLLGANSPVGDAAAANFLAHASGVMTDRRGFLLDAGRALAAELANEPLRLQSLLRELAI